MATSFSKVLLSGSTNGKGTKVAATSTPGTTIHTATNTAGELDEVWIYAVNESDNNVNLTLEWGGTTGVDNTMTVGITAKSGLQLITPGLLLNGGLVIKAFAGTTNVIVIYGFVNRITVA